MDEFVDQFFNVPVMLRVAPMIVSGLWQTLLLCALLLPIGLLGGLGAAVLATSARRALRWPAVALIDVFRAFPPLVLIIFIHAGLPFAGIRLGALGSICAAFLLNSSSYYGEIYRAGIESVGAGQVEAGRSTGLTAGQTFRCRPAPGRAQRLPGPAVQHGGAREAHHPGERHRGAGAAARGGPRALAHLQHLAAGDGGADLPGPPLAPRPAGVLLREPGAG